VVLKKRKCAPRKPKDRLSFCNNPTLQTVLDFLDPHESCCVFMCSRRMRGTDLKGSPALSLLSTALPRSRRINGLELDTRAQRILGEGQFGAVYSSRYHGTKVAIKVIKTKGNGGLGSAVQYDFKREVEMMLVASHHPRCVALELTASYAPLMTHRAALTICHLLQHLLLHRGCLFHARAAVHGHRILCRRQFG
jgi:hypothetical protein